MHSEEGSDFVYGEQSLRRLLSDKILSITHGEEMYVQNT